MASRSAAPTADTSSMDARRCKETRLGNIPWRRSRVLTLAARGPRRSTYLRLDSVAAPDIEAWKALFISVD